ncbi:hypothetical protein AEP_01730 [Curvibacter sp. AEP1-3]|uniref:DUF4019 domain-containing protein n=1 Tax=Curvibacter sp. AEP1-3 TaxID=1844971 RepID=UPI000B3C8C10|nr:DUF4019 domain-containing protein [Curvibacter sp. AEP1-3]ARV18674.1 hypothetical protein AEP_01730 [Curvibacter sp. AEP1-3]
MLGLDVKTIEAFGQIAGIGGLSLFVFVYLYREVIRKKIFPQLNSQQAYKLIRLFLILVFLFSSTGLAAWVYVSITGVKPIELGVFPTEEPQPIIISWMTLIDQKKYQEAYDQSDDLMIKKNFSFERFAELTKSARNPIGDPIERINIKSGMLTSPPGYPIGYYTYSLFKSRFSNGLFYFEVVTLRATSAQWKPCAYEINPAPPT